MGLTASYGVTRTVSISLQALGETDGVAVRYQGAGLAISSNGVDPATAIVWAAVPECNINWLRRGHLHAYAASSAGLFTKLWSDADEPDPEGEHMWAKFSQPLVANGRVYLPTFSGRVLVYGVVAEAESAGVPRVDVKEP